MKNENGNDLNSGVFDDITTGNDFNAFSFEDTADAKKDDGVAAAAGTPVVESNMFSSEESKTIDDINNNRKKKEKQKKGKKKLVIIISVILVLLIAAVVCSPMLFVNLGDSSIAEGDYETAATYYKLCFGTNDSTKRLKAANAIGLLKSGKTEEGINLLLENGITVNVEYDLDGGRFLNPDRKTTVKLETKEDFGDLYIAQKDYHSFKTWDVSRYSYVPDADSSVFDVSLKAVFDLTEYTITYTNLFSNNIENPESYTYETDTITLKNPTRAGYEFLYWTGSDIEETSTNVVIPQGSHEHKAFVANWKPNIYVVTFDAGAEYDIEKSKEVTFNDGYELPVLQKRGYAHNKWNDGKKDYKNTGIWETLSDVTVKPVFEIITYKLSYDLAGGKLSQENKSEYLVTDDDIKLVEPEKFGYTFAGWTYVNDIPTEQSATLPVKDFSVKKNSIGNMAFTANWNGNPHTVALNANGGGGVGASYGVVFGSGYTIPTPSRQGYDFMGWFDASRKQYSSGIWDLDNDISVTASWNAKKYSVSFNAMGGNVNKSNMTVTYDLTYSLPTPTRYGYTFTGWYNGSARVDSRVWNVPNNVTLTAGWKGNPHVITLDANGGSVSQSRVDVVFGNSFTLPTPTKKGHTFAGWYSGSTKYNSGTWNADNDARLTASWTVNTYEARLDVNGGSVNNSKVSCKYGSSYTLPTPTRTGYTFLGWYDGSSKINNSGTWSWDKNLSLEAKWQAKEYTVNFNAGEGTVRPSSMTVTYDKAYEFPTPSRRGYDFKGWYDGSTKYATEGTWKKDSGVSLRASWEVHTYKATLDANGGSVSDKTIRCDYKARYTLPTPTRTGYTFKGWYNGSREVDSYGTWDWDENLKLKAKWAPNDYTVSLNPSGGDVSRRTVNVTYDDDYELPTPTKQGYEFKGWYSGGKKYSNSGTWTNAGSLTLTAEWERAEYTISLDANGGDVSRRSITVSYGDSYSLPTPTRSGYEFLGWYRGSSYFSSSGVWHEDRDISLDAKWERIETEEEYVEYTLGSVFE